MKCIVAITEHRYNNKGTVEVYFKLRAWDWDKLRYYYMQKSKIDNNNLEWISFYDHVISLNDLDDEYLYTIKYGKQKY
jgi:hypothetical protein